MQAPGVPIATVTDIKGIACRKQALRPVLDSWIELMLQDWGPDDAPWWYGEQASVSLLAGAAWRANAWALTEWSIHRRVHVDSHERKPGRCDLFIETRSFAGVFEAKQLWLRATNTRDHTATFVRAFQQPWDEVRCAPDGAGRYARWGALFVAPMMTKRLVDDDDALEERIRAVVQAAKSCLPDVSAAWAFPRSKRRLRSGRYPGRYYPGAVLMLAPAPP
jgi:hypothetical protein